MLRLDSLKSVFNAFRRKPSLGAPQYLKNLFRCIKKGRLRRSALTKFELKGNLFKLMNDTLSLTNRARGLNYFYGALVFVDCATLITFLSLTRALQLTVAWCATLLTAASMAFQTTPTTSTALFTSISFAYNCCTVSRCTTECALCGSRAFHVAIST